jgi:hypothetical protein
VIGNVGEAVVGTSVDFIESGYDKIGLFSPVDKKGRTISLVCGLIALSLLTTSAISLDTKAGSIRRIHWMRYTIKNRSAADFIVEDSPEYHADKVGPYASPSMDLTSPVIAYQYLGLAIQAEHIPLFEEKCPVGEDCGSEREFRFPFSDKWGLGAGRNESIRRCMYALPEVDPDTDPTEAEEQEKLNEEKCGICIDKLPNLFVSQCTGVWSQLTGCFIAAARLKDQNNGMLIHLMYGARFSTEIYTRGCHWIPRLLKRACM